MKPKKQLEVLKKRYRKYVKVWDCYNDCPLEKNYLKELIITYCNDMIRENVALDSPYTEYWRDVKKLAKNE